jgi:hypothetical protein
MNKRWAKITFLKIYFSKFEKSKKKKIKFLYENQVDFSFAHNLKKTSSLNQKLVSVRLSLKEESHRLSVSSWSDKLKFRFRTADRRKILFTNFFFLFFQNETNTFSAWYLEAKIKEFNQKKKLILVVLS